MNACALLSLSLFNNLKYCYQQVPYLNTLLNKKSRNTISKLRLLPHPLLTETERYSGISQEIRFFNVITMISMI